MMGTNNNLQISQAARQNGVASAIQHAATRTGVDFGYLVQQAKVESSLNPAAKARTSSATGLYQFIEQTWLRMVKNHGAEHGYGKYADAIRQNANSEYSVSNRGTRNAILNLRKDPKAASLMAAELATENNAYLKQTVGLEPSKTDLYMAHFMGANGAANFLKSMRKNPWAPAASLFPEAARSNRGVFYENGKPLSLQAIYNRFDAKFKGTGDAAPVAQLAAHTVTEGPVVLPEANDWARPNSIAQRIAASTRGMQLAAFAPTENVRLGGFLRSPVDVMFMAQTNGFDFIHNNKDRYNA